MADGTFALGRTDRQRCKGRHAERVGPTQALPTTPSTSTNDSMWVYAGPKQEISLPLVESGADVVSRFAPLACQGLCPPPRALLIDELIVE